MSMTDLSIGSDIKLAHKLAKFLIETSSKIHEPKTYNKAIDNLIYKNKWRKAIDEEFQNLDSY